MEDQRSEQQQAREQSGEENACDFLRYNDFTKGFSRAIHPLLVSCSRQEFYSHFTHLQPQHQDFLYKAFTQIVANIHLHAATEFKSICEETQVFDVIDGTKRKFLKSTEVSPTVPPADMVRELSIKRKQEEVNDMQQVLQQTRQDNDKLVARLHQLHAKVEEARQANPLDAVTDKLLNFNVMLESVVRDSLFSTSILQHDDDPSMTCS